MASSLLGMYPRQQGGEVSTEWDDIQRRLGNLPPKEGDVAEEGVEPERGQKLRASGPGRACGHEADARLQAETEAKAETEAGTDALGIEGDADEMAVLAARREARRKELQGGQFGEIVEIERDGFVPQVNHAGDGVGVVVFLFKPRHYASSYMLVLIEALARKFKHVKFVKIAYEDCIPGYPERNLPTLLLYRDDDLLGQCVGVNAFGGSSYGVEDVEWELAHVGLVNTQLERNPHEHPHR